jgi:hypothetical protein
VKGRNPFEGFERDLDYWHSSGQTVSVPTPAGTEMEEPDRLRFELYTGLFALLTDALAEATEDDEEFERTVSGLLGKVQSVEPTLRFDLFEKKSQVERTEMVSRMRGRAIAVTQEWMIPRLRQDIEAYRDRIGALRRLLRERSA